MGDKQRGGVTEPSAFELEGQEGWDVVWSQRVRGRMETWMVVYMKAASSGSLAPDIARSSLPVELVHQRVETWRAEDTIDIDAI
jgi:hypothetical protein